MERAATVVLLALLLCACGTREWSEEELHKWYADWGAETASRPLRSLFYRGSDATHHHFICRPMDSWVFIMVPRDQLSLPEEKPSIAGLSTGPFPGYFAVDPFNGYRRLKLGG